MLHRHQGTEGGERAGQIVGDRRGARRHRRPVGVAGQVGEAAHRRRDAAEPRPLAVRARLAEGRDAHHHQPRVHRAQLVPAEPPPFHRARAEVLGQHVRAAGQPLDERLAIRLAQVAGDRLLVARLDEPPVREPLAGGGPRRRRSSPRPGCSTLITSAPNSPSRVQQKGAATKVARSSTERPASAVGTEPTSSAERTGNSSAGRPSRGPWDGRGRPTGDTLRRRRRFAASRCGRGDASA